MITQKHTTKFTARRVAMLSVLCAMGLITFMIESLFPPLFMLPGAKMGLSNIFSMLAVFLLGVPDAIVLVVVRTVLGSMYSNMSALIYSLTAGLVSVLATSAMVEFIYPKISVIAVSVVAAVLHNLTQNVVFCLVSNTPEMFAYMPWLALLGVVAGIIVGFAVWFILRAVPLKVFASVLGVSQQQFAAAQKEKQDTSVESAETQEKGSSSSAEDPVSDDARSQKTED